MKKTEVNELMKVFHRFRRLNIASMMPSEITPMEFHLLMSVLEVGEQQGNSDVRVSAACHNMHASNAAVSRMLRVLEEKELVYREVDTKDRRNTYIRLTEKGKNICKEVQTGMDDFVEAIFRRIGEENVEKIMELMNRMYDIAEEEINLRKKGSGTVGKNI